MQSDLVIIYYNYIFPNKGEKKHTHTHGFESSICERVDEVSGLRIYDWCKTVVFISVNEVALKFLCLVHSKFKAPHSTFVGA